MEDVQRERGGESAPVQPGDVEGVERAVFLRGPDERGHDPGGDQDLHGVFQELDRPAAPLSAACLKRKLVTLTAGENVLRLLPPLVITRADAEEAVRRIDDALQEFTTQEAQA